MSFKTSLVFQELQTNVKQASGELPVLPPSMILGMFSSASSLNLLSSGSMTTPRSGLSFRLSSAHRSANLAKVVASSMGQSRTAGSSISAKVPFSMALST